MKRLLIIGLLLALLSSLTGCWDRIEPEDQAIVVGVGFDYNETKEMYKVVMQIASPLITLGTEGEEIEGKPEYWTVSAWGHTTLDALANVRQKTTRHINYSHTRIFVIADNLVEEAGALPVIDVLERSRQSRPIVLISVTEDDPEEILAVEFPLEMLNAQAITDMINLTDEEVGITAIEDGRKFSNKLNQPGLDPVAVRLELTDQVKEENELQPDSKPPIALQGFAAFQKEQLAGFLEGREARGWNWVRDNIDRAVINLKSPEQNSERLTLIVNQTKGEIIPKIQKDKPRIKLEIAAQGKVQGIMEAADFKKESLTTQRLEQRFAQVIRNDIEQSISQAQKLESDIFGFGNAFYRLKYDQWQGLKDNWAAQFATLLVDIDIEVELKRSSMIDRSIESR